MKRILQLSLIANAILCLLTAWQARPPTPVPRTVRGDIGATPRAALRPAARTGATLPTHTTAWAAIESADPVQWIANLRAVGCPEATIRDLVTFRICRETRNRGLQAEAEALQAWDPTRNRTWADFQASRSRQGQLRIEMMHQLETLLGVPWSGLCESVLGWKFSEGAEFLPVDQRHEVRLLEQRYREQTEKINRLAHITGLDPEERQQLRDLQLQKQAELAALLSPRELEEYQARASEASQFVRQHLPQAKSEAEFRAMVKLAEEYDLANPPSSMGFRYGMPAADDDTEAQDYEQRRAAFDARLKETLGDDRIAEQQAEQQAREELERQREGEANEQRMRLMVEATAAEVGVAAADANRFVDHLKDQQATLGSRLAELEKSLTGTPEEKQKQLEAAVLSELEGMAVEAMGEKGRDFVRKMEEADRKRR